MARLHNFTCKACGSEFTRTQGYVTGAKNRGRRICFCSRKCKDSYETRGTRDVECVICGKEMRLPRNRLERTKNITCSKKCANKALDRREKRTCKVCGIEFSVKRSELKAMNSEKSRTGEFCSIKCSSESRITLVTIKCITCNKEFTVAKHRANTAKYCSYECMGVGMVTSIPANCAYCGKELIVQPARLKYYDNLFCNNECRMNNMLNLSSTNWVENQDSKYRTTSQIVRGKVEYLEWRKLVLSRSDKCENCGSKENLQVHHCLIPLYEIIISNNYDTDKIMADHRTTDPDNGQVLCKECHENIHVRTSNYKGPSTEQSVDDNSLNCWNTLRAINTTTQSETIDVNVRKDNRLGDQQPRP